MTYLLRTALFVWAIFMEAYLAQGVEERETQGLVDHLKWHGQSSFRLVGEKVIYIDPWQLPEKEKAIKTDIIFITHSHFDHLSLEDIESILKRETVFVAPPDCVDKIARGLDLIKRTVIHKVKPGDKLNIDGIEIEVVPAYNLNKLYHPKENGWVGYVIHMGNLRTYHAGDTDFIPEMRQIKTDVALLPIGGTYTMDAQEAAQAANAIRPQVAVPIHYGKVVGTHRDAERFKELSEVPVVILDQEK